MRMVPRAGLNGWTVLVVVSKSLTLFNSLSISLVHVHAIPFFRERPSNKQGGTNAVI